MKSFKSSSILMVSSAFILFFSAISSADAQMYGVFSDVFTTNYSSANSQQLNIYIKVRDTSFFRGPDFIKTIQVTAPGSTVLTIDPVNGWLPLSYNHGYWGAFFKSAFPGDKIPAGTYRIKITPKSGPSITEYDTIDGTLLPVPTVSSPANGATNVGATPTFIWTAVPGAIYYQIQLFNNSWGEPVYGWYDDGANKTDYTKMTIPAGDLKANCQYKMRIEACSGLQDMDKRSRSDWVTFTTGNW